MQINLLPNLVQNRRREARIKQLAALGLIAWGGLLVLVLLLVLGYRQVQVSRYNSARERWTTLNATVNSTENKKFRAEALEVQASLNALNALFSNQQQLSIVNNQIAAYTPKSVRLRETRVASDGKVEITGQASSYAEATKMVLALKSSEVNAKDDEAYFTDVLLAGANQADSGVAFSLTAVYVNPAAGGGQ